MWSIIAASVVDLPEPVVPVSRMIPRSSSASSVTTGGQAELVDRLDRRRDRAHDDRDRAALAEGVDAEARRGPRSRRRSRPRSRRRTRRACSWSWSISLRARRSVSSGYSALGAGDRLERAVEADERRRARTFRWRSEPSAAMRWRSAASMIEHARSHRRAARRALSQRGRAMDARPCVRLRDLERGQHGAERCSRYKRRRRRKWVELPPGCIR